MRLNPRLVVTVALVVATNRHSHGPVTPATNAEFTTNSGVLSIADKDDATHDFVRVAGFFVLGDNTGAATKLALDGVRGVQETNDFAAGEEGGSVRLRAFGHHAIKAVAGDGVAVVREYGVFGPLHFDGGTKAIGAKAGVLVSVLSHFTLEAHFGELVHRSGGESVTARLFAGERLFLN